MSTGPSDRDSAFAALADPGRRELFRLATTRALGRDEAARLLGIPRSTAAFHLERLVDAGLLSVHTQRLSGRGGPGAGRPAKLYRAVVPEVVRSIPERHYEFAAELLASAVQRADREHSTVLEAVSEEAFIAGTVAGAEFDDLEHALIGCGYQPVTEASGDVVLENCPFHLLARRHTSLVCGANVHVVRGLAAATGDGRSAVLAPHEGRCCVAILHAGDA